MAYMKKQLFIFGGFHDNLRDYKYFNDIHIFNLSSYTWSKIEISGNVSCNHFYLVLFSTITFHSNYVLGNPPDRRSGCIVLPTPDNKLLVYGGYSKERIKKDVDKGQIHTDMFLLSPDSKSHKHNKLIK